MTKAELVQRLQSSHLPDLPRREIARLVDVIFDEIASAVRKSGRFYYPDFGTFLLRRRKTRTGKDPRSHEEIVIPPTVTVGFRPAPEFKKALDRNAK